MFLLIASDNYLLSLISNISSGKNTTADKTRYGRWLVPFKGVNVFLAHCCGMKSKG